MIMIQKSRCYNGLASMRLKMHHSYVFVFKLKLHDLEAILLDNYPLSQLQCYLTTIPNTIVHELTAWALYFLITMIWCNCFLYARGKKTHIIMRKRNAHAISSCIILLKRKYNYCIFCLEALVNTCKTFFPFFFNIK